MEKTIYNPQRGRLEAVEVELTDANTTWFSESYRDRDIYSITDFEGGLLISECSDNYPVLIYGVTRAAIGFSRNRAYKLKKSYQ